MTQHTPGPWVQDFDDGDDFCGKPRHIVRDENPHPQGPFVVCVINQSAGSKSFANARLIAAAPELLAALDAMIAAFTRHPGNADERHHALTLTRVALAKAKGD